MKLRNVIAFAIAATIIAGCGRNSEEIAHHDLTSNVLIGEDVAQLGAPYVICLLDSAIVIGDARSDSLFHVFDRISNEYVGKFGRIGQGPGEFLNAANVLPFDGHRVGIADFNGRKYVEANISFDREPIVSYTKKMTLPLSMISSYIMPVIGNRYITIESDFESPGIYPYKLMDSVGNKLDVFGEYPCRDNESLLGPSIISMAYMPYISISPDGRRMVSIVSCSEIASFYEIMSDTVVMRGEIRDYYPNFACSNGEYIGVSMDEPERFLLTVATDSLAYILYSELDCHENPFTFETGNRVLVYDWDGRQVEELHLDRRIGAFAVDQDEHRLYGVTIDGSDPEIIYFDLPE